MHFNKFIIFLIPLVHGHFRKNALLNDTGPRNGEYINIEKYPYVVSIRYAKSRKVICTGILITFSWVLSVPYCFMLTPEHYKRNQDSDGTIPPDIRFLANKKNKVYQRRLAQDFPNEPEWRSRRPVIHSKNQTSKCNRQKDGVSCEPEKNDSSTNRTNTVRSYGPFSLNETLETSTTNNPLTEDEMKKSVIYLEAKIFKIIAGATSLSAEGQIRSGERIVIHPGFKLSTKNQRNPRHELALLKMNLPFVEKANLQKAPVLDNFLLERNPSRTCKLVGWGRGKTMKPLPHLKTTISEIGVKLFNSSKCRFIENTYNRTLWDDDKDPWFCSYDEKNKAIPVCQSDSGGPLVCNNKVVGLLSWLKSPLCYYNKTDFLYQRPIYYCRIYLDLVWVRDVLGESSTRISVHIEDDANSSISLGASRFGVMVLATIVSLIFINV